MNDFSQPTSHQTTPQRIRRVKMIRLGQIIFQFLTLNLLGTCVSRAFVPFSTDDGVEDWSWMVSEVSFTSSFICLFSRRESPIVSPRQFVMYCMTDIILLVDSDNDYKYVCCYTMMHGWTHDFS